MTWWRRVLKRDQLEHELDAELREHFDRLVVDFIATGHTQQEAKRLARLEFGGLDQVKEACRDERGTRWVDETLQDFRYGLRGFRKTPGFTSVAILTLALGVGANLAIFAVVDALLLRPLPVPKAAELVTISRWLENRSIGESFSYPQITDLANRQDLFASLAGIGTDITYVGPSDALEPTGVAWVSGGYFETLGLVPMAGRLLSKADDAPSASPAAVISYGYWTQRFHQSRDVVGRTLIVEGQQVPIVGITPEHFSGATVGDRSDITLAINARPILQPENSGVTGRGWRWLRILARPVPGLAREDLQARVNVVWRQLVEAALTPTMSADERRRSLSIGLKIADGARGTSRLRGELRLPLIVAMTLVTLVLLIACVNVANLLLARGATRRREIALRLAIGAGRRRILRQLLIESAMLAAAGAIGGVILASFGSAAVVELIAARIGGPDGWPIAIDTSRNWRLLGMTTLVTATITMLFGMVPAWRASGTPPGAAVQSTRIADSHGRLATALIVAQVSLSLVLVIGAGLFTRSLHNLRTLDRGFVPGNILLARFDPSRQRLPLPALRAFNQSVLSAVEQLPGVGAVSLAAVTPLRGGGITQSVGVNGIWSGLNEVHVNIVGPRYFEIMHTRQIAGREFVPDDDATASPVAMVNEAFVRDFLPDAAPIGSRVRMGNDKTEMQIVGIVEDAAYETLRDAPPPTLYVPYLQARPTSVTLLIEAQAPVAAVVTAIREAVQPRIPARPIEIHTLASQMEHSLSTERLMMNLTAVFGVLALALATIGLYGLMSYSVALRTREIGVRLALGARPALLVRMVLGSALRMVGIGVIIGLPLAWMASRLIARLVFGVSATDPMTIAAAVAILGSVGLVSAAVPARRAAAVDPVTSIHVE